MSLGTFVVLMVVVAVVILDVLYLKKHGLDDCNGDCMSCRGGCKWTKDIQKAKKDLAREKR